MKLKLDQLKIYFIIVVVLIGFKARAQSFITATGGTVTTDGNYKIHTFTSSGSFTITGGSGNIDVLVIAGGGGGGPHSGGGGGGGGVIHNSTFPVTVQSYSVTVGSGGLGALGAQNTASNGVNSSFSTITTIGGGAGGTRDAGPYFSGLNGGSGGGAGSMSGSGGLASTGQGNNGGIGGDNSSPYAAGGGGGAGTPGSNASASGAGNGGNGLAFSITGTSTNYSGGGGGGVLFNENGGNGGLGGGGRGGSSSFASTSGAANTGSGGGGGGEYSYSGGNGGSGVVIIRYLFQGTGGGGATSTPGQWTASANNIYYNNGNVGIGTININDASYKLFVETGIRTRKLKVEAPNVPWPDYVFHKDYKLSSLKEIEKFIKQNNHLPNVPSAKEVEKNGIDLGDNQALLLKKIEELTLIIIAQNKKLEKQNNRIKKLELKDLKN